MPELSSILKLPSDMQGEFDLLDCLKNGLDDVCNRLADKFGLYDGAGRPRKAFIMDNLFKFSCLGCLWKIFTQPRRRDVDALYMEMHNFAVNTLTGVLAQALNGRGLVVSCEDTYEYGRVDVAVRSSSFGAIIEADGARVVVEVKTGRSISFAQLFRYLLQHPEATLVVWRVPIRQVFVLKGERLHAALCLYVSSALARALKLLNCERVECSHSLNVDGAAAAKEPQKILDDFFEGIVEELPRVVSTIIENLKVMSHVS